VTDNTKKPITHQGNLAKLPRALAPLVERPQWAVWRWIQKPDGTWQKTPFQALQPDRNASSTDPSTWADYTAALDAVETRRADGITYVLTESGPFAAIDVDHCRDVSTHSIDAWAQNFLDVGRNSYSEITPSGTGLRIWGLASGGKVHRNFRLEIDGKQIAVEPFRRTNKPLTITGLTLNPTIKELTNIDKAIDWAVVWGERRRAAAAAGATVTTGNGFLTVAAPAADITLTRSKRWCVRELLLERIAARYFTRWSATISVVVGTLSKSSRTSNNSLLVSAAATSVKAG
jgi:hypothetical protein